MRISSKLVPAAVGAVILYLASTLAHGTPDRLPAVRLVKEDPAALRQVQVKVEWVSAAPAWTKTLTLAATEDQTVTVTLRTGALSQDEDSVTARTHVQPDKSLTVRLLAVTGMKNGSGRVSTIRTFKPGERLLLCSFGTGTTSGQVFATASLVPVGDDDPFAVSAGQGVPAPRLPR